MQSTMIQAERAILYTRPDERIYRRAAEAMPVVDSAIQSIACDSESEEIEGWKREPTRFPAAEIEGFLFDTYNDLAKAHPRDNDECRSPLATELVRRLREHEQYHEMKSYTQGDDHASVLAAASVIREVVAALPDELQEAEQERQQAERDLDEAQNTPSDDLEESEQRVQDAAEKAERAAQAVSRAIDRNGREIAKAMSQGVEKANANTSAMAAAGSFFGDGNSSVSGSMPLDQKMQLAKTLLAGGDRLRRAIDLIGRACATAKRKQSEKIRGESGEIVDIAEGDDLSRALASELALLDADPDLGLLTMMKIAEGKVLQYEVEVKETKQRGDIVVLLDESGSMSGQRELEAKAITIAMASIAAKQKRCITVLFFQTTITEEIRIDPRAAGASGDGMALVIRDLDRISKRGTGGGTAYDQPLTVAADRATKHGSDADILMITDGDARLSNDTVTSINRARTDTGLSVFTMLIGRSSGSSEQVVSKFSDQVWNVDSLLGKEAEQLFSLI